MLRLILVMFLASCASEELGYDVLVFPEDTGQPTTEPVLNDDDDVDKCNNNGDDNCNDNGDDDNDNGYDNSDNNGYDDNDNGNEYPTISSGGGTITIRTTPTSTPTPTPTPTPTMTCPEGYVKQYRRFSGFYCKRVP